MVSITGDGRDDRLRTANQRVDDPRDHRGRDERAGGVVHQHEVDVVGQRGQPGRDRVVALRSPGDDVQRSGC